MLVPYYLKSFKKQFKKLPRSIHSKIENRIKLLLVDPTSPLLNNHELHGIWKGNSSINITGDIQAIYKLEGETAIFVAIGSHSELYE